MNKKGFTLIELLGSLAILGTILIIGLYSAKGTLSTTLGTLNQVSNNEISVVTKTYIQEFPQTWINNSEQEYTCITLDELVEYGYLKKEEVSNLDKNIVKVIRQIDNKVIISSTLVDSCK